jgi:hypothetical protein
MEDQQHEAHKKDYVKESGGDVKGEKAEQPKNDQYRGDQSKHVFISLPASAIEWGFQFSGIL